MMKLEEHLVKVVLQDGIKKTKHPLLAILVRLDSIHPVPPTTNAPHVLPDFIKQRNLQHYIHVPVVALECIHQKIVKLFVKIADLANFNQIQFYTLVELMRVNRVQPTNI